MSSGPAPGWLLRAALRPPAAFLLVTGLAFGGGTAFAAAPALCPSGVFQVEAAASPLVPGGNVPDRVTVGDDGAISIESGCPPVPGKRKPSKKGTKLKAKWAPKTALCSGLPKKAVLRARFDAACDTLAGSFRSKGLKRTFTAVRVDVALEGNVPSLVHGEALRVGRATGDEMQDADPTWGDFFAAVGTSAGSVEIETSNPLPGSTLDLHVTAWTAPGAGWAQRLADFFAAIAANPSSAYAAEEQVLGGRSLWRVSVPAEPSYGATWYLVAGDTLFLVTSGDESLAADVLEALPPGDPGGAPLAAPRLAPPIPGTTFLDLRLLQPVARPVCVAEPFNPRVTLNLMAIDRYYQVPSPAHIAVASLQRGGTHRQAVYGPLGTFLYEATYFGSPEEALFQAVAPAGAQGTTLVVFPVQHCLNGTWQDGNRLLKVDHVVQTITATVHQGTLCDEHGGVAFSGSLSPTSGNFEGSDLKVCEIDECVAAGLLPSSSLTDYSAAISHDGSYIDFDWMSVQYDLVYDENDQLVGCTPNGDLQPRSFSIQRLLFGPSVP